MRDPNRIHPVDLPPIVVISAFILAMVIALIMRLTAK